MTLREYITGGGIGWIIALCVLVLTVVAFAGGIVTTSALLLVLVGALALSRLI